MLRTSKRAFGFGALIQKIQNKIQNKIQYINIKWDGEAIKGYEHSEYVLYLFNPFELTCHSEGWINEEDYRESVHQRMVWQSDWSLVSDHIYDPIDEYFAPTSDEKVWGI